MRGLRRNRAGESNDLTPNYRADDRRLRKSTWHRPPVNRPSLTARISPELVANPPPVKYRSDTKVPQVFNQRLEIASRCSSICTIRRDNKRSRP